MHGEEYGSGRMGIECLMQCPSSSAKPKAILRQAGALSAGTGSSSPFPSFLQHED